MVLSDGRHADVTEPEAFMATRIVTSAQAPSIVDISLYLTRLVTG